jgi:general secretion pathway protein F
MPDFAYRAARRDGSLTQGSVSADTQERAAAQLRAQGLTPLKLQPAGSVPVAVAKSGGLSRDRVLNITNELAVLLRAGLPLDRALKVLIDMADEPAQRALLDDLLRTVKGGKGLSQALQAHDDLFSNFYINMVRSGEASGKLAEVLTRLVGYLENARAVRSSVVSALIYPAILLVVAVISVLVMLGFVVPQFEALFADMGDAVPALTRAVIAAGDAIAAWGWLIVLGIVLVVAGLRQYLRTPPGRARRDRLLLRVPVLGMVVFKYQISNFARTTGTLLSNGVSLLQALSIAVNTVDNVELSTALADLVPAVKGGGRMSKALEDNGRFSPLVIQMVRVGEESGSLDAMLLELAKVYDDEVQAGIKRTLTFLEPILILTMGGVIAIIIIAILMGILSVNDLAM